MVPLLFGLGIASWIVYEVNNEVYYTDVASVIARATAPINARIQSWTDVPFVDVIMIDAEEFPRGCPASHPDELVYEMWQGISGMCDCLEREGDRDYFLGIWCERESGKTDGEHHSDNPLRADKDRGSGPHDSEDCFDVPSKNPIVQNVIKGARYCGKRGGVSFKDAIRPKYRSDKDWYECPSGYLPCNGEATFSDPSFGQYTVCRPDTETEADYCPITSFAFDLEAVEQNKRALYKEVQLLKRGNVVANRSIWYSKSIVQHGIDAIRVQAGEPCQDELELSFHPDQSIYYAEMARTNTKCL